MEDIRRKPRDHSIPQQDLENDILRDLKVEDDMICVKIKEEEIPTDIAAYGSSTRSTPERCPSPLYYQDGNEEYVKPDKDIKNYTAAEKNPEFLREFIAAYRAHPCLWKCKSTDYTNRQKRARAIEDIVNLSKPHYPNANAAWVTKKIQNMRTVFKKEFNKIEASKKSGAAEVYVPHLWYYNLLTFTVEQEVQRPSLSSYVLDVNQGASCSSQIAVDKEDLSVSSMPPTFVEEPEQAAVRCDDPPAPTPVIPAPAIVPQALPHRRAKKRPHESGDVTIDELMNQVLHSANRVLNRRTDAMDALGAYVSAKLRLMDERNRTETERMIIEAVYKGGRGELDGTSFIATPGADRSHQQQEGFRPVYAAPQSQTPFSTPMHQQYAHHSIPPPPGPSTSASSSSVMGNSGSPSPENSVSPHQAYSYEQL